MQQFSLQEIEPQLEIDSSGAYKQWLLEILYRYKNELEDSMHKLLQPDEYNRLESLGRALDAAIYVISRYKAVKSKAPESSQGCAFNAIFNP
jgi:hypothetical protein